MLRKRDDGYGVIGVESMEYRDICRKLNENAKFSCGHTIPYTVVKGNAADLLHGDIYDFSVFS